MYWLMSNSRSPFASTAVDGPPADPLGCGADAHPASSSVPNRPSNSSGTGRPLAAAIVHLVHSSASLQSEMVSGSGTACCKLYAGCAGKSSSGTGAGTAAGRLSTC